MSITSFPRTRSRLAALLGAVAIGSASLASCGSDPSSTAAPGGAEGGATNGLACPAGKLNAEGSTAQGNAISEVISNYNSSCGDAAQIEYNPTGSGAGDGCGSASAAPAAGYGGCSTGCSAAHG